MAELGLNINSGFFNLHANGASVFSMRVFSYCKGAVLWGLYYGGYLKRKVWWTGKVIYFVMVTTAFLGMSYLENKRFFRQAQLLLICSL